MPTIAIIGATPRRSTFANKAVRAYLEHGDDVIPIHPSRDVVEGLRAYAGVLDVPQKIDLANFYVNPQTGLRVLEECAQKGIPEIILNPGAADDAMRSRAAELGIVVIEACSIRRIGRAPGEFDES